MTITCPACASRFALPSDKIPKTAFRVACGKCRHTFTVDPTGMTATIPPPAPAPTLDQGPAEAGPAAPAGPQPGDREVQPAPVEEFQEGLRLALVCDDKAERQEAMCAAVRELGFKPHVAPRAREALAWLYQYRYELLLVHEEFGGGAPTQNPLILGLAALPMNQRRHICVGLGGKNLRTMDNVAAFHHSVHFVFNERDASRLKGIVRSAVSDNDAFYRVYREVLRQVGKA